MPTYEPNDDTNTDDRSTLERHHKASKIVLNWSKAVNNLSKAFCRLLKWLLPLGLFFL
jgi:hypothetical protein